MPHFKRPSVVGASEYGFTANTDSIMYAEHEDLVACIDWSDDKVPVLSLGTDQDGFAYIESYHGHTFESAQGQAELTFALLVAIRNRRPRWSLSTVYNSANLEAV